VNKLIRIAVALVIVALSAFYSYKAPHSPTHAAPHESTKQVAAAKDLELQDARVVDAANPAKATLPASNSPIDFKHIIGADYKRHTGEPTGGHTLLNGDVRVIDGTASTPDATGVYRAQVQMADPQHAGQWITKTDRNGNPMPNTMFPKDWTADQVVSEVNAAWFSPTKTIRGDKWSALTPSGVRVEGYLEPRVTAYPVYSKRR
jgi:Bacterial EndoU nuclease